MKAKICGFFGLEEAFRKWRAVIWFVHVFLHCLKLCLLNIAILMGVLPWLVMQSLLLELLLSSFLSPRISVLCIVVACFLGWFFIVIVYLGFF